MARLASLNDPLGYVLLAVAVAGLVWLLLGPVGDRLRPRRGRGWQRVARGSTGLAVAAAVVLAAVVAVAISLALRLGDWRTWLALMGFVVFVVSAVAVIVGLVRVLVALVRGRGRLRVLGWTGLATATVLIAALGLGIAAPPPTPVPATPIVDRARLDDYLRRLVTHGAPPSVAVVVVDDRAVLYERAVGAAMPAGGTDASHGRAASLDGAYKWWSCTKIVTAIATLQLVEQGRVRPDAPVRAYLPWFDVEIPEGGRQVRVVDLLNHSSGMRNNVPEVVSWMHLEGEAGHDQAALARDKLPAYRELERAAGETAVYTNVGYMMLGALVEEVSGEPYEDYVRRHVLRPLRMTGTGFAYSPAMRAREAVGSHPAANAQTAFLPIVDPPFPWSYIRACRDGTIWFDRFLADATPPTGLIGSPTDVARLLRAILNGGELEGRRVLSRSAVRTMLHDTWMPMGDAPEYADYATWARQGIGWQVSRDRRGTFWEHTGGGPGWAAAMRVYDEAPLGIVVMANGTTLDTARVLEAVAGMAW